MRCSAWPCIILVGLVGLMPLGALYPSKSGLMNKHIVKHIVMGCQLSTIIAPSPPHTHTTTLSLTFFLRRLSPGGRPSLRVSVSLMVFCMCIHKVHHHRDDHQSDAEAAYVLFSMPCFYPSKSGLMNKHILKPTYRGTTNSSIAMESHPR